VLRRRIAKLRAESPNASENLSARFLSSITFLEVYRDFCEMQQHRNEPISDSWQKTFSTMAWRAEEVEPMRLISPYKEFRHIVEYPRRCMRNSDILPLLTDSARALLEMPLENPPPIIVWEDGGELIIEDGCLRSLAACHQRIPKIPAYIGTPSPSTPHTLLACHRDFAMKPGSGGG